jgi:hypothetical protein
VQRILPNPTHRESLVSANQAIRIPDWMAPNPGFIMDAGQPGKESAACFATSKSVATKLPAPMQAEGLTVIEGYQGMDSIQSAFEQAAIGTDLVSKRLEWKALPRASR